MSKEKMVMFNGDMVRAILGGQKTQTRRSIKLRGEWIYSGLNDKGDHLFVMADWQERNLSLIEATTIRKASMKPGDTILVRERARCFDLSSDTIFGGQGKGRFSYDADHAQTGWIVIPKRLKPLTEGHCVPNGCFKELCRIERKVLRVWFERIRSIITEDCKAEGIIVRNIGENPYLAYKGLWSSIYPGSWDRNDWVECVEFERCDREGNLL